MHAIIKISVVSFLALFAVVGVVNISNAKEIIMDCSESGLLNRHLPSTFKWDQNPKPSVSVKMNGKWVPFCNQEKLFEAFNELFQNELGEDFDETVFIAWRNNFPLITFDESYLYGTASCIINIDRAIAPDKSFPPSIKNPKIKFMYDFITHEHTLVGFIYQEPETGRCKPLY